LRETLEINFSIPFRGGRNYNWGPDMIKKILDYKVFEFKKDLHKIYFKINKFSEKNIKVLDKKDLVNEENLVGSIQFIGNDETNQLFIYEGGKKNKEKSIEFDEKEYLANYLISENNDQISISHSDHPIALLVCANKHLLSKKFSNKKWTFAALKINNYPLKESKFEIKYKHDIGKKVYVTDINQDQEKIGQIIFGINKG